MRDDVFCHWKHEKVDEYHTKQCEHHWVFGKNK